MSFVNPEVRHHCVILLGLAALLLTAAATYRPVTRQQELRVLLPARTMVESGDWLHPVFQGQPRYRKPPLATWQAAAGFQLLPSPDHPLPGRVGQVLTALALLACTMRLAAHWGGSAFHAGLVMLLSFGFLRYAPLAETDMPLGLGICLALLGWTRGNGLLAGLGVAWGVMAKGPAALAIPGLVFLLLVGEQKRNARFWGLLLLSAVPLGGTWFLFSWLDPVARAQMGQDLHATFLETEHPGPLVYYLYTAPKMLAPGILLLPGLFRRTLPRPATVWATVTLVLLTLTPSKQDHYALLLLPPAAILLGRVLERLTLRHARRLLLATTCAVLLGETWAVQHGDKHANARFLRAVRPFLSPEHPVHVVGINSAIFEFYLHQPVHNLDSAEAAWMRAGPNESVVICQKHKHSDFQERPSHLQGDDADWLRRLLIKPDRGD